MNSKKLEAVINLGVSSKSLTKRAIDLTEMAQQLQGLNKQDRFLVQEGIEQIQNSIEDVLRRRISEQGPLQTPTDSASLVYHGRVLNAMFSFSRSFVDNNVIDLAYMPMHIGMINMGGFIFGEVTGQIARRLLRGESLDDIQQEWEDNPERTLVRYLLTVPLVGQATPLVQAYAEAALGGSGRTVDPSRSAATGVMGEMVNLSANLIAAPADIAKGNKLTRLSNGADKLAVRMVPGYGLFRHAMDLDSMDRVKDGVHQSHRKLRMDMGTLRFLEQRGGDPNIKDPDETFSIEDVLDDVAPQQDLINERSPDGGIQ
jgi:hypothetical protein